MSRLAASLAAALLLAACHGRTENVVTVGNVDDGSTVVLHSGQTLRVVLDSNPTTGYRWQLSLPSDAPLQSGGEPSYAPSAHAEGVVGSGGLETWTFTATQSGNVALHFEYRRPFEQGLPPGRTANFNISVR